MRKYLVKTDSGSFISTSRNARKHLIECGGHMCRVYDMDGYEISGARDDNDKIYQECVPDTDEREARQNRELIAYITYCG